MKKQHVQFCDGCGKSARRSGGREAASTLGRIEGIPDDVRIPTRRFIVGTYLLSGLSGVRAGRHAEF